MFESRIETRLPETALQTQLHRISIQSFPFRPQSHSKSRSSSEVETLWHGDPAYLPRSKRPAATTIRFFHGRNELSPRPSISSTEEVHCRHDPSISSTEEVHCHHDHPFLPRKRSIATTTIHFFHGRSLLPPRPTSMRRIDLDRINKINRICLNRACWMTRWPGIESCKFC